MALEGIKVIEFAGLAPGPFVGMVLADNGADVIRVDKLMETSEDVLCRGKRSIAVNAKTSSGREILKKLISAADVVIDPFRPGVLEKLGLGPEVFLGDASFKGENERLVYARISGTGPHKDMAGHDVNYTALSGVLSMLPGTDEKPTFPINLLADFAGGGSMCALGILLALVERTKSGRGQVVNVDMVSGTRYLSSFVLLKKLVPNSSFSRPRGQNLLDGGAPFYDVYLCKDRGLVSVGCLEPQFFEVFINGFLKALPSGFSLSDGWRPAVQTQRNREDWPKLKEFLERGFRTNTRQYWTDTFHGTDACVVPVLTIAEASEYETFRSPFPQPHPIVLGSSNPVAANTMGTLKLYPGLHTKEILHELELTEEVGNLVEAGVIGCAIARPSAKL